MDFFLWMLLFVGLTGAIFIFFSAILRVGDKEEEIVEYRGTVVDYLNKQERNKEQGQVTRVIDASVSDVDQVITELDDMSKSVFKEIDTKYEELLFLYNLIDEKKNEIYAIPENGKKVDKIENRKSLDLSIDKKLLDIVVGDETVRKYKNPRLPEIVELKKKGLSTDEIAKKMGIGKAEVALIEQLHERATASANNNVDTSNQEAKR